MCPDLLMLDSEEEYKVYYENNYCRGPIVTHDGIRIFFPKEKFHHAFFESSNRDGKKDVFSIDRSQRMSWIKLTLENQHSKLFQGWDKDTSQYVPDRRVSFVYENFVVVIALSLNRKGSLKGNFITCYQANNSIESIKKSPEWTKEECLSRLNFSR